MNKEIEIPEGHEARIEDNKVIIVPMESEDERIREELIGHCKDLVRMSKDDKVLLSIYEPWLAYLEKQKVITDSLKAAGIDVHQDGSIERHTMPYLEKQKEQKPIPKFKVGDCIYDKRDSYNRNVIREVGKDYYINAFAQKMDMAYTDANFEFLEHLDDDLIDSKPAEWSEEDARILYNVIAYVGYAAGQRGVRDDAFKEANSWLKSLPERFNLQPKQECSEEDKNIINEVASILINDENRADNKSEEYRLAYLAERIQSLRPQSHWKPSEQEKGALRTAIYILTEERRFPKAAAQLQNILNAFEGEESRKEWKPSDEQMDALKWLVEYVSPSEKYIIIIKKLYSDLKKL